MIEARGDVSWAKGLVAGVLIALAGLTACSSETFTGVKVDLQLGAVPVTQIRLTSVQIGGSDVVLDDDADRLFPRTPGRTLRSGDAFTLRFADRDAGKVVKVSAVGLMSGQPVTEVVTVERTLAMGSIVALPLVLGSVDGGADDGGTGGGSGSGTGGGSGDGTGGGDGSGTGGIGDGTGGGVVVPSGTGGGPGTGGVPGGGGAPAGTGGGGIPGTGGRGIGGMGGGGGGSGGRIGTGGVPGTGGGMPVGSGGRMGTGGAPGSGGRMGTGGAPGSGGAAAPPPGYWTAGTWYGCAWTGIDSIAGTTTTVMPQDFVTKPAANPYCVSGTVHGDYNAAAILGFNLAQPPSVTSCAYAPINTTAPGPPGVSLSGNGTGIAIGFAKTAASDMWIQLVGRNGWMPGATGEADRWCYRLTATQGPLFAPYAQFNTRCWDGTGSAYTNQPISSVVFSVPGAATATSYGFCVSGFAAGTSAAAAPPNPVIGPAMGTIGGAGATTLDFQRAKLMAGGKSYIIQNNNWGNPNATNQTLQYTGNSFRITAATGMGTVGPAAFPSIYIGGNGDTQGGLYTTRSDDNLPRAVNAIASLNSTFRYNTANGDYEAAYDIWLSSAPPAATYSDALSGAVMVWLYKPALRQPLGSMVRTATIGGRSWNVWVGARGSLPVVTYLAATTITNYTGDLKPFLADAATNGISQSWYVTDVFGGFEIWNGATTVNLELQEFTAVVQ